MNTTVEHQKLQAVEHRASIGLHTMDGTRIATMAKSEMYQWQRADKIVTAVNSHASLVESNARLVAALELVTDWAEFMGAVNDPNKPELIPMAREALSMARKG